MYLDSLNAIRAKLKAEIPDVDTIYVEAVPAEFVQPSFYLEHVASDAQDLNISMVQFDIQWQIVYFPKEKKNGMPDKFDQLVVAERLMKAFTSEPFLIGPEGTVYHITDFEGGPRDDEIYVSLKLQSQYSRTKPVYDLMRELHLKEEG